jgi:hypothetical protein
MLGEFDGPNFTTYSETLARITNKAEEESSEWHGAGVNSYMAGYVFCCFTKWIETR